jgi:isopenicillin N synthase-like dioxygenase
MTVPVIDLTHWRDGSDRAGVADAVGRACRDVGFLVIAGHGVPDATIAAARAAALDFFRLPAPLKRKYAPGGSVYRGYAPLYGEALSASLDNPTPPDLKESYNMGPVDPPPPGLPADDAAHFFAANFWPDEVPALGPALEAYYRAMSGLAGELMRMFAVANHHITNLSALYYPAPLQSPLPGQLRAGAHTDYGSLTILQRDTAPGGLEVLLDGAWYKVPDVPGAFVVNLGDLMADWTGGAWRSTMHRVGLPPMDVPSERLSIAFFHQPNAEARIDRLPTPLAGPRPAPGVTSGVHVTEKIQKTKVAA